MHQYAPNSSSKVLRMLKAIVFDLTHFHRRNSEATLNFNKTLCSFFSLCSTHSNLIHLIMWYVTMAAMNPAAEIQKTDKKLPFPPPPTLTKSDFSPLYDKSNLNMFLLLTQLRDQGKKKETNRRGIRIKGPPQH